MKSGQKWLRWLLVSVTGCCSILPLSAVSCALVSFDNPICEPQLHLCSCFGSVLELETHSSHGVT